MTTLSLGIQRVGAHDEPIALVVSSLTTVGGVAEMLAGAFALDAQRIRLLFDCVVLRSDVLLDNIGGLSSGAILHLLVVPPPTAVLVDQALRPPSASDAETVEVVNAAHRPVYEGGVDGLVTAVAVNDAVAAAPGALVTAIPLSPEEAVDARRISGFVFPIDEGDAAVPVVHMAMAAAQRGDNTDTNLPEGVAVSMEELEALGAAYAIPAVGLRRATGCSQSPPRALARRRWGDAPSVTKGCFVPLCPFVPKLAVELLVSALFSALLLNVVDPRVLAPVLAPARSHAKRLYAEYDEFYIVVAVVLFGMLGTVVFVFAIPAFVTKANATACYRIDAATQSVRIHHWVMGVHALDQLYPCCTPRRTLSLRFREVQSFRSTYAPVRVPPCILRTCGIVYRCAAAGRAEQRDGVRERERERERDAPVPNAPGARRGSRAEAVGDELESDSVPGLLCACYTLWVRSTRGGEAPLFWGSAEAVARKQAEWESYLRSVGWPGRLDDAATMAMRVDQGPPAAICTLGRTCSGARCARNPAAESGDEIVYWQYSTQRCVRLDLDLLASRSARAARAPLTAFPLFFSFARSLRARASPVLRSAPASTDVATVRVLLYTVTLYANLAHNLTRSP